MDTRVDLTKNRFCDRPFTQMTFLSDGTAVCACIDAGRTNPLGNVKNASVDEIWNGALYENLRRATLEDIDSVPICRYCPNRIAAPPPNAALKGLPKPKRLYLESVAACNLACPGCDRESIEGGRDGKLVMDFDSYAKIIDGLSPGLEYMEYHLGGENFMHREWPRMIRYVKERNPSCFVLTSTNGHYFRTERERAEVATCGLDAVIFSIDGATAASYSKYRVKGDFDKVIDNMRGCVEIRNRLGRTRPLIGWRYILFRWNDSKEEMDLARKMAKDIGVDALTWHLNVAEDGMSSERYKIGSQHLAEIADELWDNVQGSIPALGEPCVPLPAL
jgi:pyruvate-formate lyase-activating enzyme